MRIPTARLTICLIAAATTPGCSSAGSPGPKLSDIDQSFLRGITSYDLNRDGAVTCDEWRSAAASSFAKANKSGNGLLTEDEFRTLAVSDRVFLVASFKYYDANGDAKIDKAEFVERPNPAFAIADQDKDCRLTDRELITARNLVAPTAATTARPSAIGTGAPAGSGGRGGY